MKLFCLVFAFLIGSVSQAQEVGDLWARKAAQDRATAQRNLEDRRGREQQQLLRGLQRLPSGLNHASAKCSAGWNHGDFEHKAGDICNDAGCVGYYIRPSEGSSSGFIFTCNFLLNDGSDCHAEAFSSPRMGFSVHCVTPALKNAPRRLIYTD